MSIRIALRRLRWVAAAAAGCFVLGCGGGQFAGIEGTGVVATGPISAFGSIFVGGVEFSTAGAAFVLNGEAGQQSELRAGQVVSVVGRIDPGGTTGVASQVRFNTSVRGPIAQVNPGSFTLTVLGQTVRVGGSTSFGSDAGAAPTLATLAVGALVEVSGFANPTGSITATRIDVRSQVPSFLVAGTVAALNADLHQFALNAATIDYGAATFSGFPGNRSLQNGDMVLIASVPGGSNAVIPASTVSLLAAAPARSGDQGQIAGIITRFSSAADFIVSDTPVSTTATTMFLDGTAAGLAAGASVQIEGAFDSTGTLIASQVRFNTSVPLLVKAPVQAVDSAANTLQVLGIQVATNAETRFEDQGPMPVMNFNLNALRVGDFVEIRGRSGGLGFTAALLTREEPGTALELRGPPGSAAAPNVTVLGVPAATDANTQFTSAAGQPISSVQFFAALPNTTVDLRGTLVGGILQVAAASLTASGEFDD